MTLQNKITQIILDGAPVDMTIAQIKLMAAKLAVLVDNPESTAPPYAIKSINGVEIDQSKSHMTVVATADGLYRADNGKLTKIEPKPDEPEKIIVPPNVRVKTIWGINSDGKVGWHLIKPAPFPFDEDDDDDFTPSDKHPLGPPSEESLKAMAELGIDINTTLPETRTLQSSDGEKFTITEYGKGTALVEFDTSDNMWVLYGYDKLSEEYIDKLIADFTKQTGATAVYSKDLVYVWCNGKRGKIVYDYNGEKITLGEPVQADAVWRSTLKPSEPRPMTICYGNSMDDMFISYDDERNHWALYNWRGVDGRDKWLEEVRVKLFVNVVVSDDLQWIWSNGEWSKAEKWEVS